MSYNLTNMSNSNTFLEYSNAVNGLVHGTFFIAMLVVLYIIMLTRLMQYGGKQAFLTSSFVVFILSSVLWAVALVGEPVLVVTFTLFIISVLAYMALD